MHRLGGGKNISEPFVLLSEARFLVPAVLESTLLGQGRAIHKDEGAGGVWAEQPRERGLLFDLSRVEWAELSAVVRTVLLVESARRDGIDVRVALPLPYHRRSEAFWASDAGGLPRSARSRIDKRVRRRVDAAGFLDYLGFTAALDADHLESAAGHLRILKDYDKSASGGGDAEEDGGSAGGPDSSERPSLDKYRHNAVELTWLDGDAARRGDVAERLAGVLDASDRGIGPEDAKAITNAILFELVDNALRHSGAPRALVAAFAHPASATPFPDEHMPAEAGYMQWLASREGTAGVQVVVGDSGAGVPAVLGDAYDAHHPTPSRPAGQDRAAAIMEWAFDRDSSSDPVGRRGTRGLYRVDRVVKRHGGLITMRSSDQLVGLDHGGIDYDVVVRERSKLSYMPGTALRVHLARGAIAPGRATTRAPRDLAFEFATVSQLGDGEYRVDGDPLDTLTRSADACVVLHPSDEILSEPKRLQQLLETLAEARDPGAIAVVGIPSWDDALNACESVNRDVERLARDREDAHDEHFEIHDPVLVLGSRAGEIAWTGTSQRLADVLTELARADGGELSRDTVAELAGPDTSWEEIARTARRDTDVMRLQPDGVQLRLHPAALHQAFADRLRERIEQQIAAADDEKGVGYVTPSLAVVRRWLAIHELLPGEHHKVSAIASLAHFLADAIGDDPPSVLSDTSVERDLLTRTRDTLDARRYDMVPNEVSTDAGDAHVRIVGDGERVIVYADVISSGESVRRMLAHVLRDGGKPLAVACLADVRAEAGEPFEVLGAKVEVVALATRSTAIPEEEATTLRFLDASGQLEKAERAAPDYSLPTSNLLTLLADREALHFGHIGGSTGRHFTFYVNARRLLAGGELKRELEREVAEWRAGSPHGYDDRSLEIWYPTPEPKIPRPAHELAMHLWHAHPDGTPRPIRREAVWGGWTFSRALPDLPAGTDVAIVDWGAVEGTTVVEMLRLAAEAGAARVLVCLCLSQLQPESEWHLTAQRKVQVVRPTVHERLFGEEPAAEPVEIPVTVRFLSALRVPAFSARDCPVCLQLTSLPDGGGPTPLLERFVETQRAERLHLTSREDAIEKPIEDLDGNRVPGGTTVRMLERRGELEAALRSTSARHALVSRLRELERANAHGATEAALDIVRLLAVETQWLRRPPLVFDDIRHSVARTAASVAIADGVTSADRVNAIVVLRVASRSEFVDHADAVFAVVHDDEAALAQLLHGLHSQLLRPYLRAEEVWTSVVARLDAMMELIESGEVPQRNGRREIEILRDRAAVRQSISQLDDEPLTKTWAELRASLTGATYIRHGVAGALRRLPPNAHRSIVERVADGHPTDQDRERLVILAQRIAEDWRTVEDFLRDKLLPRLHRLEQPLRSDAARSFIGPSRARVLRFLEERDAVAEWPVAQLARELEADPSRLDLELWKRFENELSWLSDVLLEPRVQDGGLEPARLIRFLGLAPAPLHATVQRAVELHDRVKVGGIALPEPPEDDIGVFIPTPTLRTLVEELLANVEKHHVSRAETAGPHPQAQVSIDYRIGEHDVELVVRNDATVPAARAGELLARQRDDLRQFGGSLEYSRRHDPAATFAVTVRLLRMES